VSEKGQELRSTKEYLLVYCELIEAARRRGTVTYQEVAEIMGLPSKGSDLGNKTGAMVGAISEAEVAHGRPMLSAIVVDVEGRPGQGLYGLASDLRELQDDTEEGKLRFWEAEMKAVYETWQKRFKKG